jgi:hypothetical protein
MKAHWVLTPKLERARHLFLDGQGSGSARFELVVFTFVYDGDHVLEGGPGHAVVSFERLRV